LGVGFSVFHLVSIAFNRLTSFSFLSPNPEIAWNNSKKWLQDLQALALKLF
jgi:hypothetical protein